MSSDTPGDNTNEHDDPMQEDVSPDASTSVLEDACTLPDVYMSCTCLVSTSPFISLKYTFEKRNRHILSVLYMVIVHFRYVH